MPIADALPGSAIQKLTVYVNLLKRWKNVTNLISAQSFEQVWQRHIEDSIRLQRVSPRSRVWLDVGSGAGFPAIVIGVLLSAIDGAQVHCVESDGRKCAFLRTVVEILQIPVKVHQSRIEALSPDTIQNVEVVTARAFSSLVHILTVTQDYLDKGAVAVLPRGRSSLREVEALDTSRYIVTVTTDPTHSDGVILHIQKRGREL